MCFLCECVVYFMWKMNEQQEIRLNLSGLIFVFFFASNFFADVFFLWFRSSSHHFLDAYEKNLLFHYANC